MFDVEKQEPRTPNLEPRTSNFEPRTSNRSMRPTWRLRWCRLIERRGDRHVIDHAEYALGGRCDLHRVLPFVGAVDLPAERHDTLMGIDVDLAAVHDRIGGQSGFHTGFDRLVASAARRGRNNEQAEHDACDDAHVCLLQCRILWRLQARFLARVRPPSQWSPPPQLLS